VIKRSHRRPGRIKDPQLSMAYQHPPGHGLAIISVVARPNTGWGFSVRGVNENARVPCGVTRSPMHASRRAASQSRSAHGPPKDAFLCAAFPLLGWTAHPTSSACESDHNPDQQSMRHMRALLELQAPNALRLYSEYDSSSAQVCQAGKQMCCICATDPHDVFRVRS
jgi:hypothetical protein